MITSLYTLKTTAFKSYWQTKLEYTLLAQYYSYISIHELFTTVGFTKLKADYAYVQ